MNEHPETTLFKSPTVHIIEYRCRGKNTPSSDEEASAGNQISFPRFGIYKKRNRLGDFLVDPNHISFFQKNQPYRIHHPYKSHHSENTFSDISTIFEISDDLLDQMLKVLEKYSDNEPTFPNSAIRVTPSLKAHHYIILNTLGQLQSNEHLEFEEAALDFLFHVLASSSKKQAIDFQCCKSNRVQIAHIELVEQVKLVIGGSFYNQLSLADIAQKVHHTPFSLSRIFKIHTGITIHKYLLRTRLFHSLEQMMASPLGHVGQIGVDTGFSTPSHFSTAFTGEFHMSPSAFRQQADKKLILESSNFLKA